MVGSKKQQAVEFIRMIRSSDPGKLKELITREAGEELSQFFLDYALALLGESINDPTKMLANTSALMLMGYLIRANETPVPTSFTGVVGEA